MAAPYLAVAKLQDKTFCVLQNELIKCLTEIAQPTVVVVKANLALAWARRTHPLRWVEDDLSLAKDNTM